VAKIVKATIRAISDLFEWVGKQKDKEFYCLEMHKKMNR